MKFALHQAICAANTAVSNLMSVDFHETHRMNTTPGIQEARKQLMDALDALSKYQYETDKAKQAA